jgi:Flp pilus assembly protein TadG
MDMRSIVRRMLDPERRLALKQRGARGEEGATLVETALSLLILLTVLFGIVEASLMLYSNHFIAEAAREGARYAIVRGSTYSPTTCPTPPNAATCVAQGGTTGDIAAYVKNIGFPGINPSYLTVTPAWSSYKSGKTCPATGPCNSPGNQVTVTVQYTFPLTIPGIPAKTYTLTSTAAMIIQQ